MAVSILRRKLTVVPLSGLSDWQWLVLWGVVTNGMRHGNEVHFI